MSAPINFRMELVSTRVNFNPAASAGGGIGVFHPENLTDCSYANNCRYLAAPGRAAGNRRKKLCLRQTLTACLPQPAKSRCVDEGPGPASTRCKRVPVPRESLGLLATPPRTWV